MQPFTVTLDTDGIIRMKLAGSLTEENKESLLATIEKAKALVKDTAGAQHAKARVSFDLTDFTGTYNVDAMLAMKGMADHNRPFIKKTAVFGGSSLAQVAAELTIELINDPTIKMFSTREEAESWLKL